MRAELKPSEQWPRVVAGLLVCWWLLAVLVIVPIASGWHYLLLALALGLVVNTYRRFKKRYCSQLPEVISIEKHLCLLEGQPYQLAWHSFYLGDWFYLQLTDNTCTGKKRHLILSPDMLSVEQKSRLRRDLKQLNRNFHSQT